MKITLPVIADRAADAFETALAITGWASSASPAMPRLASEVAQAVERRRIRSTGTPFGRFGRAGRRLGGWNRRPIREASPSLFTACKDILLILLI
jgi:hypothetical protein